MAQMYPPTLAADATESEAEQLLHGLFRDRLGPDFYVLHSVTWHVPDERGRVSDGEADFIIVHPRHGVLVLEVKGGGVACNRFTKQWTTVNRQGQRAVIKNPFEQAKASMYVLRRLLQTAPQTRPFARSYRLGYGVWFPNMQWPRTGEGQLQGYDNLTLDVTHLVAPEEALLSLYQHFATPTPPELSDDAVDALIAQITFSLKADAISTLAVEIAGEEPRLKQLTDAQFARLRVMWQAQRQVAVPGAAGTGKTALALEMASRLALEGLDVLLVCANQSLADWLAYRMEQDPRPDKPRIDVQSVKSLVIALAKRGGMREADIAPLRIASPGDQKTLSSILSDNIRALEKHGERMPYDAVLVDEAQDIEQVLWTPIQKLLRDRANGFFYVFYDEAQRVDLPGKWMFRPANRHAFAPLVTNCRNTRAIYDLMARYNPTLRAIPFEGPPGRPVHYVEPARPASNDVAGRQAAENAALTQALDELLGPSGGLSAEDVLVITCRSQAKSQWYRAEGRAFGRHTLRWLRRGEKDGCVPLATIRSAKGLEYKVVVLAELDGLQDEPKKDALLYVAISRAMHHLVVLGSQHALPATLWGA